MAAPGSLEARYLELAGPEPHRRELYYARRHLFYTVDEWLALPWWQRRLYIEGVEAESDAQPAGQGTRGGDSTMSPLDALYHGTMSDVAAAGFATG